MFVTAKWLEVVTPKASDEIGSQMAGGRAAFFVVLLLSRNIVLFAAGVTFATAHNWTVTVLALVTAALRIIMPLGFAGIMIASSRVCDLIPPKKALPDIAFDLLPQPVRQMYAYPITEFLIDIGTRETYELAQREWPGIP
jgi:hypothetical protein